MHRRLWLVIFLLVSVSLGLLVVSKFVNSRLQNSAETGVTVANRTGAATLSVVAVEDFYGDIAEQVGSSHVSVKKLLNDPNIDPHEYEATAQDSIAIAQADVVIKNGAGYDTWIDRVLAASPNSHRKVISMDDIATDKIPGNPHLWYSLANASILANELASTFTQLDPIHTKDYALGAQNFQTALRPAQNMLGEIKSQFANTPIALTETIFMYPALAAQLNVLTPTRFQQAVAQGSDPTVADIRTVMNQLQRKQVRVLIVNAQTVTPVTTHLRELATQLGIPIVTVTETMPANQTYQTWMTQQLTDVQTALHLRAGK